MAVAPDTKERRDLFAKCGDRVGIGGLADKAVAKAHHRLVRAMGVAEEALQGFEWHAVERQVIRRRDFLLQGRHADGVLLAVAQQGAPDAVAIRLIEPVF